MKSGPKPEEALPEPEVVEQREDLSNNVLLGAYSRGLNENKYDFVKVIYLWESHYRINCTRKGKIVDSYFVRYSEDEGILWSEPNLPLAKQEL